MIYEIRNLTTGYQTRHGIHVVSKNISGRLLPHEFTCLLGPNGAGKSTLLRTLSSFQPPLEGELILGGHPLGNYSAHDLAMLVGVVLTERTDVRAMRVRELVSMGRSPYTGFWGALTAEDEEYVEQAMELVGIKDLSRRYVETLSDGERQKVMIAKALCQQTPLIFLDEPTAFLDFPSKVELMLLLARLAHNLDKTIFLSTHDVEIALQTADTLWLLGDAGVTIGTPDGLSSHGDLEHYFSGPGIRFNSAAKRFDILKS